MQQAGRYASSLLGASGPALFAALSLSVGLARAGAWRKALGQIGSALFAVLARCVGPVSWLSAAFWFASVLGVACGKQNACNQTPPSMLTLRSLTLRWNGPLSAPGLGAGLRMFVPEAGCYKWPLNSTLGLLRISGFAHTPFPAYASATSEGEMPCEEHHCWA
jgi:hypothetical protein